MVKLEKCLFFPHKAIKFRTIVTGQAMQKTTNKPEYSNFLRN